MGQEHPMVPLGVSTKILELTTKIQFSTGGFSTDPIFFKPQGITDAGIVTAENNTVSVAREGGSTTLTVAKFHEFDGAAGSLKFGYWWSTAEDDKNYFPNNSVVGAVDMVSAGATGQFNTDPALVSTRKDDVAKGDVPR
jgi:hypothetical protein